MRPLLAFFAFALGTVGAVPTPTPPTVQASGHFNEWTFEARPGALVARQAGQERWRVHGPFARPTGLQLWVTPRRVVLVSSSFQASSVFLSAYDLQTGRPLWQNRLMDGAANVSVRIVDSTPETLLIQVISGEPMFGKVYGVNLDTGKTRWLVRQDLLGQDGISALVLNYGVGNPMNTPETLPLLRVHITSGQAEELPLKIPARAGCSGLNYQGSIPDVGFTNRYLYAFRQDSCGKFIARFDWHAVPGQMPLVYPDQRPPVPPATK